MFGEDITYPIEKGPDLWDLIQALAGGEPGQRHQPSFITREEPWVDMDGRFEQRCLSLLGMKRLNKEGTNWRIEGYFQPTYPQGLKRRLAGNYSTKTRKGLLKEVQRRK